MGTWPVSGDRKDRQVTEEGLEKATSEMSPWSAKSQEELSTRWAAGGLCPKFEAQGSGEVTALEIRVLAWWDPVCNWIQSVPSSACQGVVQEKPSSGFHISAQCF